METIRNNLEGMSWGRFLLVMAVTTLFWYLMRRRTEKIEKDFFGDDPSRYRADENGVSPFDRPPVGYEEKEGSDQLKKAKEGSTTKPVVKELKRKQ